MHLLIVLLSMTFLSPIHTLFFGGGGGCGCRPQQCSCAAAQPVCPPSPCSRPFAPPTYYSPVAYRQPPPPPIAQPFYSIPHPQPIGYQTVQSPFINTYQPPPPTLLSSYNAPPYSSSQFQNVPIQVTSAKETSEGGSFPDTVIQKSKTLSSVKNDLDEDVNALSNFETSLQAYKSMSRNGIRRAQGTKIEKPEKCTSPRLQQIMEEAMSSNVSISKLKIIQFAKREFGYNFDVICSQFDFSYLISSSIYCRVELDGQICLAYEH